MGKVIVNHDDEYSSLFEGQINEIVLNQCQMVNLKHLSVFFDSGKNFPPEPKSRH